MNRPIVRLAPVLLAALVLPAPAQAADGHDARPQPIHLEHAHTDYEAGRYRQAFDAFTQRADQGDAEAARIAILMARYGSRLYGEDFVVSASKASQWAILFGGTAVARGRSPD